ncbi:hypothetical protein ACFU5O_30755 [Streptomyces sp. NPDC057445]|uniref:hypothetical protein n=1 Tax=Streptomyces sp. NPDC057445 TaxID=3346136 RepID=UPI0036C1CFBF
MAPGLTADWALWGKEPHTNSGYKVLAAYPPDLSADFNTAIHHWSPGTPARRDQLPWITIGPCTAADGTDTVGVFVLEGTEAVDRTNRPICRINHFAVPAAHVGAHALGWCALARAALDAVPQLATAGTAPAELSVAEGGLLTQLGSVITSSMTEASRWLAAAAAYLLDGTVVVTGARHYDPLQLLTVLDCVAAMLPLGMRSTLSAATGTSSGSEVRMRLYWGVADEEPGLAVLAWGGGLPGLGGLSPEARSYHDLLIAAWSAHGGEAVVRHLEGAREPLDITSGSAHTDALRVLAGLDPALAVAQEVREGREVGAERIDAALRHPAADPRSVTLLSERKLAGPSTDMASLALHLKHPEVSEAFRAQIVDDLLHGRPDSARARFQSVRDATSGSEEDLEPLDQVLALVIDEVRGSGSGSPDPVVEQLLPTVEPFAVGTMAFTQSLLLRTPGLAGRLVRVLCKRPDPAADVMAWLEWLGDGSGPKVPGSAELPVLYALLDSGSGTAGPLKKWVDAHPEAAVRLLGAAAACGYADSVLLNGFFHGLVACSYRTTSSDPFEEPPNVLLNHVLEHLPTGLRPETAARWDVLCALTDLPPLALFGLTAAPVQRGSAGLSTRLDGYLSTLHSELESTPVRNHAALVVQQLLEGVLTVNPENGEGPDEAGRELTTRLLERRGPHVLFVTEALQLLAAEPLWKETERDEQWLNRIANQLPQLAPALVLRGVHRTTRRVGGSPDDCRELAAQLYAARQAGAGNDELCRALQPWADTTNGGARVFSILQAYHATWRSYAGEGRAAEESEQLEMAFARGGPDRRIWRLYCDHSLKALDRQRGDLGRQIQELRHRQSRADDEIARLRKLDAATSEGRR